MAHYCRISHVSAACDDDACEDSLFVHHTVLRLALGLAMATFSIRLFVSASHPTVTSDAREDWRLAYTLARIPYGSLNKCDFRSHSQLHTPPLPATHVGLATGLHTNQDSFRESLTKCDFSVRTDFVQRSFC